MPTNLRTWQLRTYTLTLVSIVTGAALLGSLFGGTKQSPARAEEHSTPHGVNPADQHAIQQARDLSHAFRAASERVLPAVVMIQTESGTETVSKEPFKNHGRPDGIPDELFNDPFFRRFFGEVPPDGWSIPEMPRQVGMGSGVIVEPSGIILTNNHVVAGGDKVTVRLHDGREFVATDVKTDPRTDIAVVRIEGAGDLPSASIGDSDQLEIGDWVMAVGSPFGLTETVTAGIISAKARGIGITEREEFLQTDAAINPGNSGGPLVNLNGEVVGINTAISSTSGGYQGVGFAVPINLAKWVGDQLVSTGSVHRAVLGVGIQEITAPLSQQLGLATMQGALVTQVRPGSPAANAGLASGDVIVEFDGHPVTSPRDLQNVVERAEVTSEHTVTVLREGQRLTLKSTVEEAPVELAATSPVDQSVAPFEEYGLQLTDLTASVAEQLGIKETDGVLISRVARGSAADKAGLEVGMVIEKVDSTRVTTVDEFQQAARGHSLEEGLLLLVRSGSGSRFVVLKQ